MENLKEQLSEKGRKCNLQFSTKEKLFFEEQCGFTDEELEIFRLRSRGYSVIQISFHMQEVYGKMYPSNQYDVSKVERRIRSIKNKIIKVL